MSIKNAGITMRTKIEVIRIDNQILGDFMQDYTDIPVKYYTQLQDIAWFVLQEDVFPPIMDKTMLEIAVKKYLDKRDLTLGIEQG
jgi:hypothetical protein